MNSLDLSSFFKTKAQAMDFSIRLSQITQEVFVTDFHLEAALTDQLGLQKKDALLTLLHKNKVAVDKPSAVKEFLTRLQTQINDLPVLTLSLAFEPKDATLKVLSDWFLLNIKRHVLFDITVDPTLIAGIVIHFNGKFLDYSIREAFRAVVHASLTPPAAPQPKRASQTHTSQQALHAAPH